MQIIQLEQGSKEWLALREDKITSSDAGSIMGKNPYCDIVQLWQRKHKMIPPEPMNDRMARGQKLEEPARLLLSEKIGIEFKPAVGLHDVNDWCMTSLDGISPCGRFICEIKAPSKDTHNLAIQGAIRPYYDCQIQHHLYVSGAEKCYYASYYPGHANELVILEFDPRLDFIEEMIEKESYFYVYNLCKMERQKNFTYLQ